MNQPKPGWAFCFLAWEAGTHFSHDAAEDWTVTEISLYIYIYAFSRCFYPKWLTVHSGYTFSLVHVFPGNRTHNLLHCWRNALPLSHRNIMSSIKHVLWSASSVLGRCPEERLHWAVLLIPQGGARSVHLSRCFMMKISSCSVWFLWRGDLLAMKPPRLYLSWSLRTLGGGCRLGIMLSDVSPLETEFMFH